MANLKKLKLAYWNVDDWEVLNGSGLDVKNKPARGIIEVEISEWIGDPPIASGV